MHLGFRQFLLFPPLLPPDVGKGKKDLSGRGIRKQIVCVCVSGARARCSMRRIRHPGINAPSAFTNPDKEGCGNNKPRGKCLQTPGREVELFPPLSLTLFLSLSRPVLSILIPLFLSFFFYLHPVLANPHLRRKLCVVRAPISF